MNKKELTKKLKYTEEKCRNDLVIHTSGPDISTMCNDVLSVLKNCIELPEGATNGDAIHTMFSNVELQGINKGCIMISIGSGTCQFSLDWWGAPYKKEVEQ